MSAPGDDGPRLFLLPDSPPQRDTVNGWEHWRTTRHGFVPAPRLSLAQWRLLSPRKKTLHDLHRTATHANLPLLQTPMTKAVTKLLHGRVMTNALKHKPATRAGSDGHRRRLPGQDRNLVRDHGHVRDIYQQLLPGHTPGTRDLFVPVAYCRLPVRATPKALCKTILDVYGDPHASTLDDLVRSVRAAIRDHTTTALLIDDITRLRLHRGDDQDTLDLIRELMDLNVTLVLIGVDIPGSGLLRGAYVDPGTSQWVFPDTARGNGRNPAATERRFDLVDLNPFDYTTAEGMNAFLEHLAGIEGQLRLLRAEPGMLTTGAMPEYLFRRTHGIVGLLRRLIEDGCAKAISTGEERLTPELLAGTAIRLGNLADLDPESGEIPPIPQDVQPPRRPRGKTGKKPRNTVFDDHGDRSAADG